MRMKLLSLLPVASILVVTGALAQDVSHDVSIDPLEARLKIAADALKATCAADVQKFCASVSPGGGRLFFCMLAHEDKISGICDYQIYKSVNDLASVLGRIEEATVACASDIEQFCIKADAPEGEVSHCLISREAALADACRAAAQKLPAHQ